MPEGLFGVLLGNINENFELFKHLVNESDCIVGPMCEFEFHSYDGIPEGAWVKIQIPHLVSNPKMEGNIKVISRERYQDCIEYAQKLEPEEEPPDSENIYFRFNKKYIEIFTHHFSQFIVYAENSTLEEVAKDQICCTRFVQLLGFEKWIKDNDGYHLEVIMYVSSLEHEQVFI